MKNWIIGHILVAASGGGTKSPVTTAPPRQIASTTATPERQTTEAQGQAPRCHTGDALAGVYSPQRLRVVVACKTVTGVVVKVRKEADGDLHVALLPDDSTLLTDANRRGQGGALILEIVPPTCPPTQASRGPCGAEVAGIRALDPPPLAHRISATGPYVLDDAHGGWAE